MPARQAFDQRELHCGPKVKEILKTNMVFHGYPLPLFHCHIALMVLELAL